MTKIDDKVLERLEAEAQVADAEAEELTIAVESDIEQTEAEVEELQATVEEKENEVEELQSEIESKESEIESKESEVEELQGHMTSVKEMYAEELAKDSKHLDKSDYLDKFEFEELQERYEAIEVSREPDPNSGDGGAGFQSPNEPEEPEPEAEELSGKAKAAVEQFRRRGGVWEELAEDIEENGLGEVRKANQPADESEIFN